MDPITREEQYLNRLTGEYEQTLPEEPITRKEQYLSRLCGSDNIIPQEPLTREEQFLANLCGEEVDTPEPLTRLEQYMAFAGGESEAKPASPLTRQEKYWDEYQGGAVPEEKTLTGNPISVSDALAQDALSLQVAFTPTQDGTPSIDSEPTTEPYLSKVVPRGNKEYYSLVGGTVAWNQLVQITDFVSVTYGGITGTNNGDGTYTVNGRATDLFDVYRNYELTANHVYFVRGCPQGGNPYTYRLAFASKTDIGSGLIYKSEYGGNETLAIRISNGTEVNNLVFRPQLFDLTLMFGTTIADYAYSLEQSEAGSGIAWLKSYGFFTKDYYPYNEGELISVNTSGHKIGSTTYPIDPTDLRGLFKLDSANKPYCEGDAYSPSGSVARKKGSIDLGTANWAKGSYTFYAPISDMSLNDADIICSRYLTGTPATSGVDMQDKTICSQRNGTVFVKDDSIFASTTATQFKDAMSGVYLEFDLAIPTAESATPYTSPIDVEEGGTEEFVDNRTVPIPVGNETYYASEYAVHGKTGVTVSHGATEDDPNPTEYEVEFTSQGTVYGGTVDIVTGVLTVTWGHTYLNSLNWEASGRNDGLFFDRTAGNYMKVPETMQDVTSAMCQRYPSSSYQNHPDKSMYMTWQTASIKYLAIIDSRYADYTVNEFKNAVKDVPLAYELATPLTYQLTPQQVQMLLNDNYLTTNDGTITLTYMAKAAERVRAMNAKLTQNKQTLALKKAGSLGKGDLK